MRLLIVTPWFPTTASPSSGIFVVRDAVALSARHQVIVVHLSSPSLLGADPETAEVQGIPVHRVAVSRANPLHWMRALRTVRRAATEADAVHTQAISGLIPFTLARPGANLPWVHTEHWSALTTPQTLPTWARPGISLISKLLARPDVVTAVCNRLAIPIRKVRKGPIEIIGCIINPAESLVDAPRDPRNLRLIGVGALVARKGPLTAIRTIAELRSRGIPASLTWVGAGPQHDEALELAADLGVSDAVSLTGTLDDAGVRSALDASDMMLLPTLGDNFCTVVAEALSHGRPIVSGIETGANEYTAAEVGEFVAEQTPQAYADAVERVLFRTSKMSARDVADTLGTRYAPETVVNEYTAIYESLVAERGINRA